MWDIKKKKVFTCCMQVLTDVMQNYLFFLLSFLHVSISVHPSQWWIVSDTFCTCSFISEVWPQLQRSHRGQLVISKLKWLRSEGSTWCRNSVETLPTMQDIIDPAAPLIAFLYVLSQTQAVSQLWDRWSSWIWYSWFCLFPVVLWSSSVHRQELLTPEACFTF